MERQAQRIKIADCDLPDLDAFVESLPERLIGTGSIVFDISQLGFARPALVAPLVCAINRSVATFDSVALDIGDENRDVVEYLKRFDFFNRINVQLEERFRRHPAAGRFVPIRALENPDTCDETAYQVADVLVAQARIKEKEIATDLATIFIELIENFYVHAESHAPAYLCAQHYRAGWFGFLGKNLEIAIADTGIGIKNSLMRGKATSRRVQKGESPCKIALEFGTSAKEGSTGYGLFLTAELVRRNNGVLRLISDHESLSISGRGEALSTLRRPWPGTIVVMRISTRNPIDLTPIYDYISRNLAKDYDDLFG